MGECFHTRAYRTAFHTRAYSLSLPYARVQRVQKSYYLCEFCSLKLLSRDLEILEIEQIIAKRIAQILFLEITSNHETKS